MPLRETPEKVMEEVIYSLADRDSLLLGSLQLIECELSSEETMQLSSGWGSLVVVDR